MSFQIETSHTRTETAADLAAARFAGQMTEYTDAVYTDAGRSHVFAVCGLPRPLPAAGFLKIHQKIIIQVLRFVRRGSVVEDIPGEQCRFDPFGFDLFGSFTFEGFLEGSIYPSGAFGLEFISLWIPKPTKYVGTSKNKPKKIATINIVFGIAIPIEKNAKNTIWEMILVFDRTYWPSLFCQ